MGLNKKNSSENLNSTSGLEDETDQLHWTGNKSRIKPRVKDRFPIRSKSLPALKCIVKESLIKQTSVDTEGSGKIIIDERKKSSESDSNKKFLVRQCRVYRKQISDTSEETKRRAEWRTLQQHYYPEGGWGWLVLLAAVFSHALAHGAQLSLSNVIYGQFQRGKGIYIRCHFLYS
ncbi:unnamed protein product [Allacma fusca]|uniref:Uncharacterized protein n=1 Tax=Allacma fusca TaxID=39272 RepID=A0A8J2NT98_9HEXA|nr:unnamed protein product [Allacma fusca]